MSIPNFPESLRQAILVGMILVGRLGVMPPKVSSDPFPGVVEEVLIVIMIMIIIILIIVTIIILIIIMIITIL